MFSSIVFLGGTAGLEQGFQAMHWTICLSNFEVLEVGDYGVVNNFLPNMFLLLHELDHMLFVELEAFV